MLARIFLPFALGYYLSYLYRNVNAIIFRDLSTELSLQAGALGLLTSAYFLSFALFQLPLGLLLDRFGPRRVDAALLCLAGVGALAFSYSHSVTELVWARALIGLGVSGCLMSSIKAFTLWMPLSRLAALNGWLLAMGGLGAMSATVPVEAALHLTDWRGLFQGLCVLTFLVAGLILAIAPERHGTAVHETVSQLLAGLRTVLRDRFFWRVSAVNMTSLGISIAIQGLWIAPWLRDVAQMDRQEVARCLLAMTVAMTLGFWFFGNAAGRMARHGIGPTRFLSLGAALGALSLALIIAAPMVGATAAWTAVSLWLAFNFFTTAGTLGYAILSARFSAGLAGRVATSLNMATFVSAFASQLAFGALLDLWPSQDGRYPVVAYNVALGVALALQLVAVIWLSMGSSEPKLRIDRRGRRSAAASPSE